MPKVTELATLQSSHGSEPSPSEAKLHTHGTPLSSGRGSPKRTGREGKTGLGPLRKGGRTLWSQKGIPSPCALAARAHSGWTLYQATHRLPSAGRADGGRWALTSSQDAQGGAYSSHPPLKGHLLSLREQQTWVDIPTLLLPGWGVSQVVPSLGLILFRRASQAQFPGPG